MFVIRCFLLHFDTCREFFWSWWICFGFVICWKKALQHWLHVYDLLGIHEYYKCSITVFSKWNWYRAENQNLRHTSDHNACECNNFHGNANAIWRIVLEITNFTTVLGELLFFGKVGNDGGKDEIFAG